MRFEYLTRMGFFFTKIYFCFQFLTRNGFIYEVQTGLTIVTESPTARRGFSCLSKLNQRNEEEDIYVIGGESETDIVEKYDVKDDKFVTLPERILVGRSRSACASVPKNYIRHLGYHCA